MRRRGMPGAFGARMPTNDHGPALVDLIQKTVRPASWDINGGPGSIYDWYPGRALTVRQTDLGHDDLGALLQQLQRAGR